jgi:hypothetical protein
MTHRTKCSDVACMLCVIPVKSVIVISDHNLDLTGCLLVSIFNNYCQLFCYCTDHIVVRELSINCAEKRDLERQNRFIYSVFLTQPESSKLSFFVVQFCICE